MKQIGRDLNAISEEFARSSERNRVMERAQQVDIDHVNYEDFKQFLEELFANGITRERIVVLFFFCSDVVVRAYTNRMASFKRLFNWFLNYILNRVCGWVANHGGWKVVLGTYVPAVSQTLFYWLGSAAIVMFMYKKLFNY
ncbi:apoptosis regulator BAX-like protein [Euroglyphus maynei]|uniref:Apoptosis regulator BAX-like protein n=1 Tax=Euroglyphus maynei TaxID=6958 RepID=A0A1Y3ATR6_EURMA|nr:apoptosis regulator BAX-like protein [Euroglyphus maynei]